MKKLLIFIVLVVAGYLVYTNFIKEKEVVKIDASYVKSRAGADINAPTISPKDYGHYEGTIKNISDKTLTNLIVTYLIDGQESEYKIDNLAPGREINFTTKTVMLRHANPPHYLKSVLYDKE